MFFSWNQENILDLPIHFPNYGFSLKLNWNQILYLKKKRRLNAVPFVSVDSADDFENGYYSWQELNYTLDNKQ